jgi:uncharacterized protein YggE
MPELQKQNKDKKIVITFSWKLLSMILLILLIGLLIFTKPWQAVSDNPRTIEITGEATIKRAPDSFVFTPSYEADNQETITTKTNEVVAEVKRLGLGDAGIQTQVSNYENYGFEGPDGTRLFSVYMTLSVEDKELAQKIQDYLIVSGAKGQITPMAGFTKNTQKTLKEEATILAVEDAKRQAEQTASNLGVKLGKVIRINESNDEFEVYPISSYDSTSLETASLPINSGESEFPFSIKVEFEIK